MLIVVATAAVALHSSIPLWSRQFFSACYRQCLAIHHPRCKICAPNIPQTPNPKPQTPKPAKVLLKPLSHQTLEPCCRKLVLSLSWGVGGRGVRNYISLNRPYEVLVIGIKAPYLNRPY